jgi:dTDP-4-dehydrorhamnose reductase
MRTLIFGINGQLGRDLLGIFEEQDAVSGFDLPDLDIRDRDTVVKLVREIGPEMVINAAAFTDVEAAEDRSDDAFAINEAGARNVAAAAALAGVPVVYYSTDYVFDGKKGSPYEPDDPINPMGVYGRSKAAGEAATREANKKHFIIRTAWLYGPGGNNFVEKILRAAAKKPSLRVVEDEVGSPTHTQDLAAATLELCQTEAFGTYHAVNSGWCSRYEFAKAILEEAKLKVPVEPCSSAEYPMKAPRPSYSVLSNTKLEKATPHKMRSWRQALEAYMERKEAQG